MNCFLNWYEKTNPTPHIQDSISLNYVCSFTKLTPRKNWMNACLKTATWNRWKLLSQSIVPNQHPMYSLTYRKTNPRFLAKLYVSKLSPALSSHDLYLRPKQIPSQYFRIAASIPVSHCRMSDHRKTASAESLPQAPDTLSRRPGTVHPSDASAK